MAIPFLVEHDSDYEEALLQQLFADLWHTLQQIDALQRSGRAQAAGPRAFNPNYLRTRIMGDEKENPTFEYIQLKVLGQDNSVAVFKMKTKAPMKKLMRSYCYRGGLIVQAMCFRFNGNRIDRNDTPTSLQMLDGDTIEVYERQTGG